MGGEFGGKMDNVYVWLNPCAIHLKLSQYCLIIGYTPRQNIEKINITSNKTCNILSEYSQIQFNQERTQSKLKWRDKLKNNWSIYIKGVQVTKGKERPRGCDRL